MANPCQVDFYVLEDSSLDASQLAGRLALMAWERGHRVTLIAASEEEAAALDKQMWQTPRQRFVPHEQVSNDGPGNAPVTIRALQHLKQAEVVINLCEKPLPDPQRFVRLLEIVPQNSSLRDTSRLKYKAYRQSGIEPKTHKISK